jgi:hypothetical protein
MEREALYEALKEWRYVLNSRFHFSISEYDALLARHRRVIDG